MGDGLPSELVDEIAQQHIIRESYTKWLTWRGVSPVFRETSWLAQKLLDASRSDVVSSRASSVIHEVFPIESDIAERD